MAVSLPIPTEPAPPEIPPSSTASKRQRWFELSLVMLVAFSGPVLRSIYILKNITSAAGQFTGPRYILGVVQEVTALLLLGYVLSRTARRFRDIGFHWSLREAALGIVVAVAAYMSYVVGYFALQAIHSALFGSFISQTPDTKIFGHMGLAAVPFVLINPFFEELLVRAYLMTELIELTRSYTLSVAVSVTLQFSYHLYYGWWTALSMAFSFLIFALSFAASRRSFPVITAHALFDLYALLRLW
jgi:membrane protease YdiL (CAAX protease family)